MSVLHDALKIAGFNPGENFQLAAIHKRKIKTDTFNDPEEGEIFTIQWQWQDLYLCLNPLRERKKGKAVREDILIERCQLFDFDPLKDDDDPEGTRLDRRKQAEEASRAWQKELGSGVLVDSGRGFQLWVRHVKGVDREALNTAARVFCKRWPLVKLDGTFNGDRLARLPGTVNHKTGRQAVILG